jgi:hypothetical protein
LFPHDLKGLIPLCQDAIPSPDRLSAYSQPRSRGDWKLTANQDLLHPGDHQHDSEQAAQAAAKITAAREPVSVRAL